MLKRSMGQRLKFPAHLQKLVRALHTSIDKFAQKNLTRKTGIDEQNSKTT